MGPINHGIRALVLLYVCREHSLEYNNSLTPIYCTINIYSIQFSCPIKRGELKTPLESLNIPTEYTVKKG
jgi:hypothetical protein